jgi:hypothetical protein
VTERRPAAEVPFWVHQLVEMLLALLLLIEAARTGQHTAVLVALGGTLLALSLASDGALGAWHLVGRRTHRGLDFAFAALFAVSPVVLALDRVLAIVVIETVAVGLAWLAWRTSWGDPATSRRRAAADASPPPTAPASPRHEPAAAPAAAPAASLAHRAGSAVGRARTDAPRRLGRLVGRARARARKPPTA